MKINGEVKDAINEKPLADAKIRIYVGEKELAALYSNREGRFEFREAASYIDKTLICQVEKEGFKPQKVTYKIGQEEIQLDIELVSLTLPPKEKKKKEPIDWKKLFSSKWPIIAGGVGGVAIIAIIWFIYNGEPEPGKKPPSPTKPPTPSPTKPPRVLLDKRALQEAIKMKELTPSQPKPPKALLDKRALQKAKIKRIN